MAFEVIEATSLDKASIDISEKMSALRSGFKSSLESKFDSFMTISDTADGNVSRWLGIDATDASAVLVAGKKTVMDTVKQMYDGVSLGDGKKTVGLRRIAEFNVSDEFKNQNYRQQAGFAAEVVGTAKENLQSKLKGTGITTYRADDRPDLFTRNDQYVDKVRVNSAGEIVERVQVKFVGENAEECLSKLASKKYDKYFNDGMVDKMEVPKDFYDDIKRSIPNKISGLEEQLQKVKELGKDDVAQKIEAKIERYKKIDKMLEKSTVTKKEALEARLHPRRYAAKLFVKDTFAESNKAGVESAALAVTITAAVSTVDNVCKVFDGEMTAQEAFVDVAKDTGIAGGAAYGTVFVSTAVAQTMSASSHQLIQSLGSSGIPATVISFGVESFDSIVDYADGVIDGKQLAYDLGENTASIGGSVAGSAIAGAVAGSVVPGAGTLVGFGAGLVGGMVGCAVASEAYVSAVEFGVGHVDELADKTQEMANRTVKIATEVIPDHVGDVVASLNNFAVENDLPFRV